MRPEVRSRSRIGAIEGVSPRIQVSVMDCSSYLMCPEVLMVDAPIMAQCLQDSSTAW